MDVANIEEYIVENGSIASETDYFDFNDYQNIRLLPPRQYVVENLRNDPAYSWLIFGGFWGEPWSYPSIDEKVSTLEKLFDMLIFSVVNTLTGSPTNGFLATLLLPNVPNINVAPGSPYEGYYGFNP